MSLTRISDRLSPPFHADFDGGVMYVPSVTDLHVPHHRFDMLQLKQN